MHTKVMELVPYKQGTMSSRKTCNRREVLLSLILYLLTSELRKGVSIPNISGKRLRMNSLHKKK